MHDGTELESFPASAQVLNSMEVRYKTFPGWKGSKTSGVKSWEELPSNCRAYIEFIEHFIGVKIKYVGTGRVFIERLNFCISLTAQVLLGQT